MKKEIWNIVLAAGLSTRMQGCHKLALDLDGETILRYTVKKVLRNQADHTVVVLNQQFPLLVRELSDLPVSIVWNHVTSQGMSSSLKLGIECLPSTCDAAMILLADQPEIKIEVMNEILTLYQTSKQSLIVTSYLGKTRHPIIFGKPFFKDLMDLTGDEGAKSIIQSNRKHALIHTVEEKAPEDIDTVEDYISLLKRRKEIDIFG
ncbi:nucleotidyltransferase family protein [Bacillus sp. REN16]|uniref:nucleotidyltransferase family protein n=1 Tax=Bacillus sp. REN16 TaxID=2887296 RepID=UPI001E2B32E9|nr:nucleotidyltransferase family protein [Bacillus sp. REN16]MCC3357945.1 nucleotidyltransferase family protein [Bacillus sp. REN16]